MAGQYNIALRMKYEQKCPDCGESDFVEDHAAGDLICRACGVVVEAHTIDERSEWRTFGDKDKETNDPNRVGGPVNQLLSDGGMSTMIAGARGVDRGLVSNLQRMQARTEGGSDRNLITAFREVGKICGAMKLPDTVKSQANEYYKEAYEKSKSVKGKPQAAVYSAVIFLACRQQGYPRTFMEICTYVPDASKKDIGRIYKRIVADLKLKETGVFKSEVGSIHPENYLRRFMSMLGMANVDMNAAIALANAALPQVGPERDVHTPWHGKSPISIAGAIIYITTNLPRASKQVSLDEVSVVCGVAEATIRLIYSILHPHLGQLIEKAGGFATPAEIAQLPAPLQDKEKQQQQQQQQQQALSGGSKGASK